MGQLKWAVVCALVSTLFIACGSAGEDANPFGFDGEMGVVDSGKKSPREQAGRGAYSPKEAERRIEEALNQRLRAPIEATAQPLNILMTQISQDYDIPVVFDTPAFDEVAISPDVEVNMPPISNVSLRSALELLLNSAGTEDLTYVIENEVLLITTAEEAEQRLEVKIYPVRDLLASGPGYESDSDYDQLIDAIVTVVEHDSWMENGTGEGEIVPFRPGMIVVSQTHRVQRQVEDLLENLRSMKAAVEAERSEGDHTIASQAVTRAFRLGNRNATDPGNRESLQGALKTSVDWQADGNEVGEDEVFLHVFDNTVLVRHSPTVVWQVEQVVREINSVSQPAGVTDGGRGDEMRESQRGGGYGGRGHGIF